MKRKVNRVGQNTLTVSLPSKWVKENDVKQGDELEIIEEHNKILLSKGTPAKIEGSAFLGEVRFPNGEISAIGERSYETPDYNESSDRIRIKVSSVFGSAKIDY